MGWNGGCVILYLLVVLNILNACAFTRIGSRGALCEYSNEAVTWNIGGGYRKLGESRTREVKEG